MKLDEMNSQRGPIMLSYLRKKFYQNSSRMLELLDTLGMELDGVWYTFDDILDQCFIDSATWGLDIWEEEFALQPEPSDTYEIRRARIKARIIGFGTFTEEKAINLANTFSRTKQAQFIKMYDQYAFRLIYNVDDLISYIDLKSAFEQMKPAHLLLLILISAKFEFHNNNVVKTRLRFRTRVNFFGGRPWYFDGIEYLDGSASLSGWVGDRDRFKNRIMFTAKHRNANHQEAVIKRRHNYWLLDGSVPLDGSRLLSSSETTITI